MKLKKLIRDVKVVKANMEYRGEDSTDIKIISDVIKILEKEADTK